MREHLREVLTMDKESDGYRSMKFIERDRPWPQAFGVPVIATLAPACAKPAASRTV